jgi:3-oxoacyl-[acyl-carrier protein] reductase
MAEENATGQPVVLVTGAARGIGRAIADRFVAEGAHVFVLDREFPEQRDRVVDIRCDITDDAEVAAAIDRIDRAAVERCLSVNVVGLLRMCQAVIPHMKKAGSGRIINAASFAAIIPAIGGGAYAASKSAVVQLTRALAGELGPWDITVNAYAPGMIPTAMNGFAEMAPERQEELLDTLTLRRWGSADDVADLVSFLASERAGYITGTLVDVSGGKLATQLPRRAYEAL